MARGWESKSVEAQQDAVADRGSRHPEMSRAEAARQSERATLMLARTRVQKDLSRASAAAHRAMLEAAMADLDRKIAALDR